MAYRTRNVTFEALLFWYMAYRTRNITYYILRTCKSMTVDFLHYNSCVPRPIAVGRSDIEQVHYVVAVHCDYIAKKANRELYALRQLKKCKVPSADIVHIYCALIRSVLEYTFTVFADQPRSQGSLLPDIRSERERDPGKRWSRGSRTKLFLREESFVLHFLSGFFATFT